MPYTKYNVFNFSAGGLVTAVAPVVIKGNGLWVGWPGIHSKEPLGDIPESDPTDQTPTAGLRSDQVIYNHCLLVIYKRIACFTDFIAIQIE